MTTSLQETTIRDFGGGWNVSDSDKSLKSKFQTISDNVVRQTDGSFAIRPGTKLHADLKQGVTTVVPPAPYTVSVSTTLLITITNISKSAVGGPTVCTVAAADIAKFANGQTVNVSGADATHSQANGLHVISSVNVPVNTFAMVGVDTSGSAAAQTTGTMRCTIYTSGAMPGVLKITKTAHGYVSGQHINITSWSAPIAGITEADILGNHGILVHDANSFSIYVRKLANAATSATITIGWTHDTHMLGGKDIYGRYYKDRLYVFSDTGEIVAVDYLGVVTMIWNYVKADAIKIEPWGPCKRISAEIIRGRLICVNGALNDKPLDINGLVANYLTDGSASPSNAGIPRADFVIAADRYVLLISTENGASKVDVSAKDTVGVFERNSIPDDAVEVDLGMLTQSVESTILGANVIRSRVFIGFNDRSQLGTLGTYTGTNQDVHNPDFKDNVAQFGTFSHASIISLGNDLLCAGLNGINSLEISRGSGEYTPTTVSDFIHPVMLRHFSRLSEEDRRYRTFAVWDINFRSYMLFAPKYSDITYDIPDDAIILSESLQPHNLCFILYPSHTVDAGDWIDISGVENSSQNVDILGSLVNGRRRVRAIYDDNMIVVECDGYISGVNFGYGGSNIKIKPVNDESPAYVFEYNKRLKISRWTRFKGMDFDWGAISQLNKLFFGKNGRIYKMGNNVDKFSADKIGDYTKRSWANNTVYTAGDRVLDGDITVQEVFTCLVDHTSPSTGTFKQYRNNSANYGTWEPFEGFPIKWEMESAWSDFGDRKANKQMEIVGFDTEGSSEFEFSIYTDTIRTDFETFDLIPNRTTIFIGQDAPGFGTGGQPYGGGRNTRQEWLRGMPVYGKLFRLRFAGVSTKPLQINAVTLYYHKSKVLT